SLGIDLPGIKKTDGFGGLESQDITLRIVKGRTLHRVILMGLGKRDEVTATSLRRRLQRAGILVRARDIARPAVILPAGLPIAPELVIRAAVTGLLLGFAPPLTYAAKRRTGKKRAALAQLVLPGCNVRSLSRTASRSAALGDIIVEARSWVAEPANVLGPAELARNASRLAKENGASAQVWTSQRIRKERMRLLDAVGKGSERKPRFVRLRWTPKKRGRRTPPHVVIVGKGIVFDTGGLSLKTAKGMPSMKNDMAGAAVAAATVAAAAAMNLPVRVTGLLSIAENTPSSTSYRPGDVIRGRGGKSVEIINTDAEGRLVMADALTLASEMKPDAIIDVATLTGSCIVALGSLTAGLWSNDDSLATSLLEAADQTGESMWRMPLSREIRPYLRSDVADIRNTASDPWGGATAAALFLQEFVSRAPWAHLDIAGPAFNEKRTEAGPRGATGYGITTLVRMLENLSTS
ncbi:MAG: leucyl aminopeptidase, partial [Deltaproteobacteria bacterium]|nr:leucyl aminopeptidase [Deltaproteobacteria bacterium]